MTRTLNLPLASLTAIAAALTFTATPSLAQVTPDAAAPPADNSQIVIPDAAPAPQTAAPALPDVSTAPAPAPAQRPVYAAPAPVVQATPNETPEQASPSVSAASARSQPRAAASQVAAPARATPAPASTSTSAAPATPVSKTPKPIVNVRPQTEASPAPAVSPAVTDRAAEPQSFSDTRTAYILAGGGVLLLLGTGAAVYAMTRRRRVDEPVPAAPRTSAPEPVMPTPPTPAALAVPVISAVPQNAEPIVASAPMARAATARGSNWPELEDMIAAKPDAANPFITRSKRMRRAKFLLAHGEVQPLQAEPQPSTQSAPERQPAAAQAAPPRPSYDFSGTAKPRTSWKPITT